MSNVSTSKLGNKHYNQNGIKRLLSVAKSTLIQITKWRECEYVMSTAFANALDSIRAQKNYEECSLY